LVRGESFSLAQIPKCKKQEHWDYVCTSKNYPMLIGHYMI